MTNIKYYVTFSATPGSRPSAQGAYSTLRDARRRASVTMDRSDLKGQDVRIERPDGSLVEYAGPNR